MQNQLLMLYGSYLKGEGGLAVVLSLGPRESKNRLSPPVHLNTEGINAQAYDCYCSGPGISQWILSTMIGIPYQYFDNKSTLLLGGRILFSKVVQREDPMKYMALNFFF